MNPRTRLSITLTLVASVSGILLLGAPKARACSLERRPTPPRIVPAADHSEVPTNVFFSPPPSGGGLDPDRYFWTNDGDAVDLEVDADLTDTLTFAEPYDWLSTTVYRPIQELEPGDRIAQCYRDSCGETSTTVVDVVDETPPERPTISDIQVTLYDNPAKGKGTFCPELDFIEVDINSSDDTTPLEAMRVLIYGGPTRDSVEALDTPEAAVSGEQLANQPDTLRIQSWLGLDSQREAVYSPLSRGAEVCFSVALMDWAGNVSDQSEIECVDTRDPSAPYAEVVEGSGCGCSSTGDHRGRSTPVLLFLFGALLLRVRRR